MGLATMPFFFQKRAGHGRRLPVRLTGKADQQEIGDARMNGEAKAG